MTSRTMHALVWRRADVRESSRLVTLLTRERGKLTALAKGAHRPDSVCLGRLDFLNRVDVRISGRGMPLVSEVRLLHEPRALREPARFLAATHFAELLDAAFVPERVDAELFDLAVGGITLFERAPLANLPTVLVGLEARFLRALGLLGALDACGACGCALATNALASPWRGELACASCGSPDDRPVSERARTVLATAAAAPAREIAALEPRPGTGEALDLLGGWIENAVEFRPRLRRLVLDELGGARSTRVPASPSIRS